MSNHPAGVFNEEEKEFERSPVNFYRLAITPQLEIVSIKVKGTKFVERGWHGPTKLLKPKDVKRVYDGIQPSEQIFSGMIQASFRTSGPTFSRISRIGGHKFHRKENTEMKFTLQRLFLSALIATLFLPALAFAQSGDNDGCTNATLTGDYAFRVSGWVILGGVTIDRQGVAMTHFDGAGNLTQVDFVMSNGAPLPGPTDAVTGFHIAETGTYKVNSDCTGRAEIHLPKPPNASSGAVLDLMFVLSDQGRNIHTIVSRLLPPGSSTPALVSIHSDGEKLGQN